MFEAGLAQMHVHIDEARRDEFAFHIAYFGRSGRFRAGRNDFCDLSILYPQIRKLKFACFI